MSALRNIRIEGGPDARSVRLIDDDTGEMLTGVVKVELLMVPGDGVLVNVTQGCCIAGLDVVAHDVGAPLIDLPDEPPVAVAAVDPAAVLTPDEIVQLRELLTRDRMPPIQVVPAVKPRRRRTQAEIASARVAPPAPLAEPPPLPEVPTDNARRAPPPEPVDLPGASVEPCDPPDTPTARTVRASFRVTEPAEAPPLGLPLEDDLSPAEKAELAELLAARAPTPIEPSRTPWPFPSSSKSEEA